MTKPTILIVDDEEDFVHFVKLNLERSGKFKAIGTTDPYEALRIADSAKPDLILMDVMMPEVDGGEMTAQLRENESTKDIPVVFVSAILSVREEQNNISTLHEFLAKPITPERLIRKIDSVLQGK